MNARQLLAATVLVASLSAVAAAQTPVGSGPVPPPGVEAGAPPPCWFADSISVPIIGLILQCWRELSLSGPQIARLERLGIDLMREQIRREADLQIAQLDLGVLLRPDPDDPGKPADIAAAEAKIRETERITSDLYVALLRAVEAGKAELTADQRRTLAALLSAAPPSPLRAGAGMSPRGASGGSWYYCRSAGAYYPYVQTCPEAWATVGPRGN